MSAAGESASAAPADAGPASPAPAAREPVPGGGGASTAGTAKASPLAAEVNANGIIGAGTVSGSLTIHNYGGAGNGEPARAPLWEELLTKVERDYLPPQGSVDTGRLELVARKVLDARILLVRHGQAAREDAIAALRAVLHWIHAAQPGLNVFHGDPDSGVRPSSMTLMRDWDARLRNAIVYLDRSEDADAIAYFHSIERVGQLRARLRDIGAYLLVSCVSLAKTRLRDEETLAERIALWSIEGAQALEAYQPLAGLSDPFELAATSLAALLPGMGAQEYRTLLDQLLPPPPPVILAAAPSRP